jgi:fructose transport system substrate-binding protein
MNPIRRRAMRLAVVGATVALAAGMVAGSGVLAQSEAPLDGAGVKVTLVVKENINPFWVWMIDGATARAEELGAELQACWGAFDPDPEGQVECIENAIAAGSNALLIAPANAGVVPAIEQAREAGMLAIALDTQTDPPDAVDATFATDNFEAGLLIGQWAAAKLGAEAANAKIAFLDLDPSAPPVDRQRDQGFMQGFGIDVKDADLIGDEDDARIVGHDSSNGNEEGGRTAMENLLQKDPGINVVYTINEPAARGAALAIEAAGKSLDDVLLVSVDGGCAGVTDLKNGIIDATSMQFPSRMASLGVDAAIRYAKDGTIPEPSEGLAFFNTGVQLISDDPQEGVASEDSTWGLENCWGSA